MRKPKYETLNIIANALDVDIKALIDPNFNDPISVMYALFELDRIYGVDLKCVDGSIALSFLTNEINEYIKVWEEKKRQVRLALTNTTNDEEKMNVLVDYEIWKWEFSKMYSKKQNIALICDIKNREKQVRKIRRTRSFHSIPLNFRSFKY